MHRSLTAITVLIALALGAPAQEPSPDQRLRQIADEVARRRQIREAAHGERGIVFAPFPHPDAWYRTPRELKISASPLVTCGEMFATLAKREVMISGRVAQKKITLATGLIDGAQAFEVFSAVLEREGIAIVPIGARILALVEKSDAPP